MRYALVSLHRHTGTTSTVRILTDSRVAIREANRMERDNPAFRYTVIPFLGFHDARKDND